MKLAELFEKAKRVVRDKDAPQSAAQNLVAKHMRATTSGSGAHDLKSGPKSKRSKQKRAWKKEVANY